MSANNASKSFLRVTVVMDTKKESSNGLLYQLGGIAVATLGSAGAYKLAHTVTLLRGNAS